MDVVMLSIPGLLQALVHLLAYEHLSYPETKFQGYFQLGHTSPYILRGCCIGKKFFAETVLDFSIFLEQMEEKKEKGAIKTWLSLTSCESFREVVLDTPNILFVQCDLRDTIRHW